MAADWYCRIAGAELGPLSSQHLKALAADGRLRAGDEVCQGKGGKWVQAGRVKGLFKSSSNEVLVARPLDEEGEPAAGQSGKRRSEPAAKASLPKAKTAPQPPEPPQSVPVAKVTAVGGASASAVPAQSPFVFKEPDADQRKSSIRRSGALSASDMAKNRRKRRKKLLIGSVGAAGGVLLVLAILWIADPFGMGSAGDAAQRDSDGEPLVEGELSGDLETGLDDLLGGKEHESGAEASADAADDGKQWLDASKDTATAGPVSVRVVSTRIDRPRLESPRGTTVPKTDYLITDYLIVDLELTNNDPAKKAVHSGWGGRAAAAHGVSLRDNHGNRYKPGAFPGRAIKGQQSNVSLYADEPVHDILVFERPVEAAEYLRLTLPASAVEQGGKGMLRFQIPTDMLGTAASDGVADAPRRRTAAGAESDADDEEGEVYQLEAIRRAIGMEADKPDRPIEGIEELRRKSPELFPEQ